MKDFNKEKILSDIQKNANGNIDFHALKKAADSGNADALISALSDEDKKKLTAALSDKQTLNRILKEFFK